MEQHQHWLLLSAALCFNKVKYSSTVYWHLHKAGCMIGAAEEGEGQRRNKERGGGLEVPLQSKLRPGAGVMSRDDRQGARPLHISAAMTRQLHSWGGLSDTFMRRQITHSELPENFTGNTRVPLTIIQYESCGNIRNKGKEKRHSSDYWGWKRSIFKYNNLRRECRNQVRGLFLFSFATKAVYPRAPLWTARWRQSKSGLKTTYPSACSLRSRARSSFIYSSSRPVDAHGARHHLQTALRRLSHAPSGGPPLLDDCKF